MSKRSVECRCVPCTDQPAVENASARDHRTVTGLDGADIVTQLIEHAFQVSQASGRLHDFS